MNLEVVQVIKHYYSRGFSYLQIFDTETWQNCILMRKIIVETAI